MTQVSDDYSAYVAEAPAGAVDLSQLQELATAQAEAEAEVARIEAQLERAKGVLKNLAETQIPTLMDQIGLEEFTTRTGLKIKIDEVIRASIPKARTAEAYSWLTHHNSDSMIKRNVVVPFGRGESDKAQELALYLSRQGYTPENTASVHSQTLSAWVREKLRGGEEIPLDLFGVFRQRVSKISN